MRHRLLQDAFWEVWDRSATTTVDVPLFVDAECTDVEDPKVEDCYPADFRVIAQLNRVKDVLEALTIFRRAGSFDMYTSPRFLHLFPHRSP